MESIEEFYNDFRQQILLSADSNEEFIESAFVNYISEEFLVDSGEIDAFDYCHYKAERGVRVDGYNLLEDEGVLNLFVSEFRNKEGLTSISRTEVDAAFKRLENFFIKSLKPDFYPQLEETSPGYGLAHLIHTRKKKFSKVRLFLLTNGLLSSRIRVLENNQHNEFLISYNVWDISRLYRLVSSKKTKEDIVIDFLDRFGYSLPCLPAHLDTNAYNAYLVVIPGDMLAALYSEYGARLLEQNVRCFLQFRGNVNKGIRNTIHNDPEMFFAYNNGITATAEDVEIDMTNNGYKINKLKNFQIVNGGQTTASIFTAMKKDKVPLDRISVQMKLSIVDPDRSLEVVPKISEYANSQNKVNAADFFANHPFHIRMEEFSRRLWTPSKEGVLRQTKWFYERARGQYLDAMTYLSPAAKRKFKDEFPKPQMFTKTDLAKFENAWEDCPHIVSRGAQKNFAIYAGEIGKRWSKDEKQFNELYFKHVIAKAIIFRTTEKLVMKQPWYGGGYRANIVVYSISWIAYKISTMKRSLDFSKIWGKQEISNSFYKVLEDVSLQIHEIIIDTPQGISNVTEWCKKDGCWEKVKSLEISLREDFLHELTGLEEVNYAKREAKKTQKIDDGIKAQRLVLNIKPEQWEEIITWGINQNLIGQKDVGILRVATKIPNQVPSEKQSIYLMKLLDKLEKNGFQL